MEKKRVIYYDLLNIASCFAVICIHHNGLAHTYSPDKVWRQCLLAEVAFYWAVPVFLMLSGANLLNYRSRYSTKRFFEKRILRVVVPWISWSIIILLLKVITHQYAMDNISCKEIVNIILNCKVDGVYWFFPMIISMYLFIPVLSLMIEDRFRKVLWYLVGVSLILNGTIPLLCALIGINWNSQLSIPLNGYVIFIILGYLLSTQDIQKLIRRGIYLLGVICLVVRYLGVYILSTRDGCKNTLFFSYTHIYSYGLAISVFVLFKYVKWELLLDKVNSFFGCTIENTVAKISGCSLGIYLIHNTVMSCELQILQLTPSRLIWRTGGCLLTYLICLLIVLVIKKVPLLKNIVP